MRLLFFFSLFLGIYTLPAQVNYSANTIPEELLTSADAVVRNHRMDVRLLSNEEMTISYERVVTVLNEKGNRHVRAYAGYNKSQAIKSAEAEVFDKNGNSIKRIKKKDLVDVSAVDGGTLYSDSRMLYMSFLPTDYPYSVRFSYSMKTKNTGTIPSWYFLDDFRLSVERSSYQILFLETSLEPKILEKNFGDYEITPSKTDSQVKYETNNIPALKDEYMRPGNLKIFPMIMVCPVNFHYEGYDGTVKGWKDVGSWMNDNLLNGMDELSPSTVSEIQNVVSAVENPLEKAKLVYNYVQENTRYISVQVGIGGLQPISAIDVDRVKYGDCKGLSNYTKALLKAVGVESYYVHVEAGPEKIDFEADVASLAQGNHVILAIPYEEKYYWVDCTSQVHPFGFLGDFTDGRRVLLMKPEGGEITYTDAYLNEDNLQITKGYYALDEEGNISGNAQITTKGIQYDQHFGIEELSKTDVDKYYKNYLSNINDLVVSNYSFENNKDSIIFKESIDLFATRYASKTGDGKLILVPNCFNNSQKVPPRYRNRKFPLEIQRGYMDVDEYEINLPANYDVQSIPPREELNTKFGNYSIEFWKEGNALKMKRKIFIKSGMYPNSDYKLYRSFKRGVTKLDNTKIILTKKT